MFSRWLFIGDEFHPPLFGAQGELSPVALAVALLLVVLTCVGVFLALGEHRVDRPRQLVRSGGDGLGFVHA